MRQLWMALRYSSTLPVRAILAVSMLVRAVLILWVEADADIAHMISVAPAYEWAALFGVNGLLLTWRILDNRPRVELTRAINVATCSVLGGYIGSIVAHLGALPSSDGDTAVLLLFAVWVTLRTNLTASDKESA
ncbi:MAG: hypothetical protein IJI03_12380 [Rudaea sp.]|nr:hypothetical protein [Rudaea sp.]